MAVCRVVVCSVVSTVAVVFMAMAILWYDFVQKIQNEIKLVGEFVEFRLCSAPTGRTSIFCLSIIAFFISRRCSKVDL